MSGVWLDVDLRVDYMGPMVVFRVTTVTPVCTDYDSYLKIGPNQKIRGLDC